MSAMQTQLSKIKDYPKFLNDHWALHLAPRAKAAPTFISLFAGCGGSSLGYSFAGFTELLAVEWDDNAVETFKLNFPGVPVYHGDITELSVDKVLEMTGLKGGELDVLDGSPPCQGFSTAGKRVMQDSRNFLFREYARLLKGLQPKVFVMENVSGMVKGKMKLIFAEILRELKRCGYKVKAVLMNAMYFGVPQSRQRMIFVGVRNDVNIDPTLPIPVYKPPTVEQAFIGALPDATAFTVGSHTKIYKEMMSVLPGGSQPGHHSHIRLPRFTPSPAILADSGFGHYHYWHPEEHRVLTFTEQKIIASFPPVFTQIGKPGERWARIGNSVPPLFMKAIAEHIRKEILDKIEYKAEAANG